MLNLNMLISYISIWKGKRTLKRTSWLDSEDRNLETSESKEDWNKKYLGKDFAVCPSTDCSLMPSRFLTGKPWLWHVSSSLAYPCVAGQLSTSWWNHEHLPKCKNRFSEDLPEIIVDQSNLYGIQCSPDKELTLTVKELEKNSALRVVVLDSYVFWRYDSCVSLAWCKTPFQ